MSDAVKVIDVALSIPATLPCPVHLEPGLKFGKGVRTKCVLDALRRRADYYAELEAMTPEQRAEHDAGIAEFKAMLGTPAPVVPDEYRHLSELYHAQEKRLFKLAQRIKGPSFDKYAHSPSQAIDVLEAVIFGEDDDSCRAVMLQAGNSPVTPDGWVACSERMPPNKPGSYEYIVFDSLNNKAHHDYWNVPDGSCDEFTPFWNHYGKYVTHWMPLPAPPK
ncbi:hypothetical protein DOQ63_22835 [Salmonella enterica subsp. enterica serovar Corvallis]|nr:DUF551 domain-containing protein [Salmonella enterica]EBN0848641.1 DUF551 domain-containing protein [Salmonella enterica]EBR6877437.1 DUF551 domain-containing protein [Salmonella enterica]EBR8672190.1 hypothetical protein [Salmonella enterica subsp. enterica serovar Corvallis]EEK3983510.1 DUF551 domain-containing protein [Salmonella enterica]